VVAGILTGPALLVCYVLYLSLVTVGQDFLAFQWDFLLLEAGVISIFLAPWRFLEPPLGAQPKSRTPAAFVWLLRLLLFKLMFLSGVCKLASQDPTWANLSALDFHYETQPLPTPFAWLAGQLPHWFQHISVVFMFAIELLVPFAIFAGRKARACTAVVILAFQLLIALTGNYTFFNFLTMALCVSLLDDGFVAKVFPAKLRDKVSCCAADIPNGPVKASDNEGCGDDETAKVVVETRLESREISAAAASVSPGMENETKQAGKNAATGLQKVWRGTYLSLAVILGCLSVGEILGPELNPVAPINSSLAQFGITNRYGLFAVMTTVRNEIIIEGSNDRKTWLAYEFPFKPGDLNRAPAIVAPYQPRLDWQMWFAALSTYDENPWLGHLMVRLLHGNPEVLALFSKNPFPDAPPKYIRASLYTYHFTDMPTLFKTGAWWRRQYIGPYFPVATLQGPDTTPPGPW
jgi:hypothetical protein